MIILLLQDGQENTQDPNRVLKEWRGVLDLRPVLPRCSGNHYVTVSELRPKHT